MPSGRDPIEKWRYKRLAREPSPRDTSFFTSHAHTHRRGERERLIHYLSFNQYCRRIYELIGHILMGAIIPALMHRIPSELRS
jgi:hypothetical protein